MRLLVASKVKLGGDLQVEVVVNFRGGHDVSIGRLIACGSDFADDIVNDIILLFGSVLLAQVEQGGVLLKVWVRCHGTTLVSQESISLESSSSLALS